MDENSMGNTRRWPLNMVSIDSGKGGRQYEARMVTVDMGKVAQNDLKVYLHVTRGPQQDEERDEETGKGSFCIEGKRHLHVNRRTKIGFPRRPRFPLHSRPL